MYNFCWFSFFPSRMFEPTFSLFRHFVYLDLSRNLVPRSSHSLRLSRHFEYISILVGNFGHVILLCARVFSRAAAILKSEKTLGTRLHPLSKDPAGSRKRTVPRPRAISSFKTADQRNPGHGCQNGSKSSFEFCDINTNCLRFVLTTVSDSIKPTPEAGNNLRKSHFIVCHVTKYSTISAIRNEEKALGTRLTVGKWLCLNPET